MPTTTDSKPTYEQLEAEVIFLRQELDKLRRMIYGQKRERYVPLQQPDQLNFNLAEQNLSELPETTERVSYVRRKGKKNYTPHSRKPLPAHLRREEIVIEPEEDVTDLKKIGEEITEELEYKPGELYVNRYIRPKYALSGDDGVVIGLLPSRPIDKGIAGPGLLSHVLISKFVDHLPLHRQRQQFKRQDVDIAASTIGDWVAASCEVLTPMYHLIRSRLLRSSYLMADETPIRVLDHQKKGSTHLGYHWVYYSPLERLVLFDYRPGRSRAGPNQILAEFEGYLQTDGYTGYDDLIASKRIISVGCFAHARRYFVDAQQSDPERAEWMLEQIQQLYKIERQAREAGLDHEARHQLRERYALSILETIHNWLKEQAKQVLPKSALGKAVGYMLNQWPRLERYVTDGRLEIDNNLIENLIRPVALGRKNYLFAGSHEGAERAAIVYSMVATAKQNQTEPFAYLKDIISRIADHPHNRLAELLPPQWKSIAEK
jgi:transposase